MQGLIFGERLCQSCDPIIVNHIPTQLQMSQRRIHLFSGTLLLLILEDSGDCTSAVFLVWKTQAAASHKIWVIPAL